MSGTRTRRAEREPQEPPRADSDVIASFFSERGHAAAVDGDLDRHLEELAASEGLDDELVRECRRLLSEWTPVTRTRYATLEQVRAARRAREHLLVARLHFETGRLERAEARAEDARAIQAGDAATRALLAAIKHRRGRLSEAIALWQELLQERRGPSAVRYLGQIFELSLRGGGDAPTAWAVPAELQLVVRDALPELERSFRLAFAHDLGGAVRVVDRVAERFRSKDPYIFKLAALQRAWLLEQAHDVMGAIASLERLADEPGFASDVERLLCLSMLYEREGTPERLRRAVRAVRHAFLATREPTLLRRLARLLSRLGHHRLGQLFEARYLEAFRHRMHALTLREFVRSASAEYVPIAAFGAFPYPERSVLALLRRHLDRRRLLHRRRAAVLALLARDVRLAADLWRHIAAAGAATPTDLKYLGDAEAQLGRREEARASHLLALQAEDRPDPEILARLAGASEGGEELSHDLRDLLRGPRLVAARGALRDHARARPHDAAAWRALARVERARGDAAAAGQHARRAELIEGGAPAEDRVGRVLAAAAFRHAGEVRGLLHELWVSRHRVPRGFGGCLETGDVLGSLSPELRGDVVNIFHAVKAYARARFPAARVEIDEHRYIVKFTKEDEPSSGDSAGLAVAIAVLSCLLGLPVPDDVAMSGAVISDAHDVIVVRRVGDVDAKIEGAYERRLRTLVLPAQNREDVERAERVPRDIATSLVLFVATLDEAVAAVFGEDALL